MPLTDEELDQIVAELDQADGRLPRGTILKAREHRDQVVPRLIAVLRETAAMELRGEPRSGYAPFFALFLLAEFQAEEAWPALLDVISLPGESAHEIFGEALFETLPRVLAVLKGENPDVIDRLIANPQISNPVRSAAAGSFLYLARDGRMTREEALEYVRRGLREAMAAKNGELVSFLLSSLCCYAPQEAWDDIQEAYRLDLADPQFIALDDFKSALDAGAEHWKRELERCEPTVIDDTIAELEDWACFREQPNRREFDPFDGGREKTAEFALPGLKPQPAFVASAPGTAAVATIRNAGGRVGRNDPCPCGSGKKFKQCCKNRTSAGESTW